MKIEQNEILSTMIYIGMPMSNVGTAFVIDSLELLSEKEYSKFSDLYNCVAEKHGTNAKNVEKCMARAFNSCRDRPEDYRVVNQYLGYCRTGTAETLIHLFVQIKLNKKVLEK